MRKEKQIEYLKKRIETLENIISDLQSRNEALTTQTEREKRDIASKIKLLAEREKQIDDLRETYESLIDELKEMRSAYNKAIQTAIDIRNEYSGKMRQQLKRIRKEK